MSGALIQTSSSMTISIAPNELVFPCFTKQRYTRFYYLPVAPQQQHAHTHFIFRCQSQSQSQDQQHTSKPKPTKKPLSVYLTETLGFTKEKSLSASDLLIRLRHVEGATDVISCENADKVISYFQDPNECGFDLSQVIKIVTKYPAILTANVDKTIRPKIANLQQVGFSTSHDLAYVLASNPHFYLSMDMSPAIEVVREFMGSDHEEYVVRFFRLLTRGNAAMITKNLVPNLTVLEDEIGISRDKIRRILRRHPCWLLLKTESLRDLVVKIEDKWGITRDSTSFLRALAVCGSQTDEKIDSKCQVYRSFGWSQSDIQSLVRRSPYCIASSEAWIRKSLEFYMNELRLEPAYLASRSAFFSMSLENRVLPRHRVLTILKEKGRIKPDYQLYSCLNITDKKFYDKFISPYDNVIPELREIFMSGRVLSEAEASESESETLVLPNVG